MNKSAGQFFTTMSHQAQLRALQDEIAERDERIAVLEDAILAAGGEVPEPPAKAEPVVAEPIDPKDAQKRARIADLMGELRALGVETPTESEAG